MPSPMKFTSEIYIAWTTFLGSTTTAPTDHVVTFDFNSVLKKYNHYYSFIPMLLEAERGLTQEYNNIPKLKLILQRP